VQLGAPFFRRPRLRLRRGGLLIAAGWNRHRHRGSLRDLVLPRLNSSFTQSGPSTLGPLETILFVTYAPPWELTREC